MPSVPNRRRVKRPTVLVKKSQLKQKSYNNSSRNLLYEKLKATKANNNALAKALSMEKQESQFLFTQTVELNSQLQDIGLLVNNRDEVLSGILKNATDALKLLVQVTNCVTSTIVACQTIVGKSQSINSRSSTSINSTSSTRRESMRRSTGKSPARGVVQPMVSGHTITKPVINLSRINMPRIRTSPNLSVIDESIDGDTPERSPVSNEGHTPRRISLNRLNRITTRRVERLLPERIRLTSPRMSEENDQLSDNQNRRLSNRLSHVNRHSRRSSRKLEQQDSSPNRSSLVNGNLQITIKSPRVTLQDVSPLLQNSQSINIGALMKSTNKDENKTDRTSMNDNNDTIISETQDDEIIERDLSSNASESFSSSPTYNFDPRKKRKSKQKETNNSRNEDPLEGPSWLYNTSQSVNTSGQNEMSHISQSAEMSTSSNSSTGHISKSTRWSERQLSKSHSTHSMNTTKDSSVSSKEGWGETYCAYSSNNVDDDNDSDDDEAVITNDNEDDIDKCENLTNIVVAYNLRKDQNDVFLNERLRQSSKNITRQRGNSEIDVDDFTMMFNPNSKQQTRNMNFDINELNLPVLEQPLINPVEIEPEPEITTTIKMITQTYHRRPSIPRDNMEASLMDNSTSVLIPMIRDSTIHTSSDFDINNSQRNNDNNEPEETTSSFMNGPSVRKRKRIIRNRIDSSSDSELSMTPGKVSTVKRKNNRKKDPSAVKVVLEKLENTNCKNKLLSFNSRLSTNNLSINSMQSEAHSDSDGSNASSMMSSGRPRRQKAPINLKEPKLGTKLRRL